MKYHLSYLPMLNAATGVLGSCFSDRENIIVVDHLTVHLVDPNDWEIVFVLCAETTFKIRHELDRIGNKLVLLHTSNEPGLEKYTKFFFPFWLFCVDEANRYTVKPKDIDKYPLYTYSALLGRAKDSRTVLLEELDKKNMLDQGLISYHSGTHYNAKLSRDPTHYFSNIWEWESTEIKNIFQTDINYIVNLDSTTRTVDGHFLSCLLPWKVYYSSCVSIVAETDHGGAHTFISEKTWKPILAGHPFIMYATADHTNFLESLGFEMYFKTYGDPAHVASLVADVADTIKNGNTEPFKDWEKICRHNTDAANPALWKTKLHRWLQENFVS